MSNVLVFIIVLISFLVLVFFIFLGIFVRFSFFEYFIDRLHSKDSTKHIKSESDIDYYDWDV